MRVLVFATKLIHHSWCLVHVRAVVELPQHEVCREWTTGCREVHGQKTKDTTMADQRAKIAALVADAFQEEEEHFFPKVALNPDGNSFIGRIGSQRRI
jgi:hypothetical protein